MRVICRVPEGQPLPDFHSVVQILATQDEPTGAGTNVRRVYTLLLEDQRFWLSDEAKLATSPLPARESEDR